MADAVLPENTLGGWVKFGTEQTANLDVAGAHAQGAKTIIDQCEKRDAELVAKLTRKKFLGIF